jgi:hypothetical protein
MGCSTCVGDVLLYTYHILKKNLDNYPQCLLLSYNLYFETLNKTLSYITPHFLVERWLTPFVIHDTQRFV